MAATSAGILLFRRAGEAIEVLLVHPGGPYWTKKDDGAWSIPKGELGEGEELLQCARRELEEELGGELSFAPADLIELGSVRQRAGKVVHCWALERDFDPATLRSITFSMEWPPRSGVEREFPEVDRAEWFDLDTARAKLVKAQTAFVDALERELA